MNTFDFRGHTLRTIDIDGTPWFHAADICRMIYPNYNTAAGVRSYLNGIDADERRNVTRESSQGLFEGKRGGGRINLLNESGLYKLILRAQNSRPEVAAVQNWVTREVLPAIRRTGGFTPTVD